jgi:hypothetical protein
MGSKNNRLNRHRKKGGGNVITVGCRLMPFTDMSSFNNCFGDVEEAVRRHGGEAVYGWLVEDAAAHRLLTHHAVWRMPGGQLRTISPQLDPKSVSGGKGVTELRPIRFIIDSGAVPERHESGRAVPRMSRFVALRNDPRVAAACRDLTQSEVENRAGNRGEAARLTARAKLALRPYGYTVEPPVPVVSRGGGMSLPTED